MTENWIGLVGIAVAVLVPLFGAISTVMGWLVLRAVSSADGRLDEMESKVDRHGNRITRVETVLAERGLLPAHLRYREEESE